MTDKQENTLGMYRAVSKVFDDHSGEYSAVGALVTQVANVNSSIALISQLIIAQTKDTTGVTVDKRLLNTQMVDMALRVAGALKAFGSESNNNDLLAQATVNPSEFTRARDDQRDDIAQRIHNLANANIASLAPYGVTAATLTALQTRIDTYVNAIGKPRAEQVKKSTATDLLQAEFARVDMILEDRIDGLMEQFKEPNPTFYSDYQKARIIVDNTGGSAEVATPPTAPTP